MDLARERAVMHAVGRLTEADLEKSGITAALKARGDRIEIEDIGYAQASCEESADGTFECEGIVYFGTNGISDAECFHVAGRFDGDEVSITGLRLIRPAASQPLAAAA